MPAENSRSGNSRGRRAMRAEIERELAEQRDAVAQVHAARRRGIARPDHARERIEALALARARACLRLICSRISRWRGGDLDLLARRATRAPATPRRCRPARRPRSGPRRRARRGCFSQLGEMARELRRVLLHAAEGPVAARAHPDRAPDPAPECGFRARRRGSAWRASILRARMQLIDIGANLTHPAFHADLPEVLARARERGRRRRSS